MQNEKREIKPLSLLMVICERKDDKEVVKLFNDRGASFNLMMLGKGTANSKILNYLGLGQSEKTFFQSVMPMEQAKSLLHCLDSTLDLKKPGHGIAFTLSLNGACTRDFSAVQTGSIEERKEEKMNCQPEYELIVAVANRGYNQEVMDAARMAKATGGTILNARGFALANADKFFGVTLQSEKEVILILAQSDKKCDIMKAIAEKAGLDTEAGAVSFSLPVSDVKGLQSYSEEI